MHEGSCIWLGYMHEHGNGDEGVEGALDISRKTDYALRMMSALVHNPGTVLSVRTAAEENNIPYSFARSIQHDLAEAGIITSTRGAHGGMSLAVDPESVTLLDVVQAVQGPVCLTACDFCGAEETPCPRKAFCSFNPIWNGAQKLLETYLASFTLSEAALGTGADRVDALTEALSSFIPQSDGGDSDEAASA